MSHPTMGAWIEILPSLIISEDGARRTPRWVRGLKSFPVKLILNGNPSHPTMGAWIEIRYI